MIFAAGFSTSDIDPTTGVEVQLADGASEFYGTIDELVSASNTASSNATALSTAAGAADAISFDHKFAGEDIPTDFVSYADLVQARNTANAEKAEFFSTGVGSTYATSESDLEAQISGLRSDEGLAAGYQEDVDDANEAISTVLSPINTTYGTSYTGSADIQSDIDDLTTLLNGDDGDNKADNVTGFFDAHSDISDLADLHSKMVIATVTTSVEVIDSTARTVDLDEFEVARLGEGRVDIVATQTDAAGNLHEGDPRTAEFIIDTVTPTVDITDDQDGTASDGENSVTYTLTFSEPVQSVTAGDLEVDGGVITDVDHTPGEMTGATAKVTVTVDDDSTDPVEIKVTSDILDVAGNPLITKTDSTQQVDTDNPSTKVADGETTNPAVSAELITILK